MLRSQIYAKQMNLSKAVDDISIALTIFKSDPELYVLRGDFYQQLSKHSGNSTLPLPSISILNAEWILPLYRETLKLKLHK